MQNSQPSNKLLVSSKLRTVWKSYPAPSTVKLKTQSLPPKVLASVRRNSKAKKVVAHSTSRNWSNIKPGGEQGKHTKAKKKNRRADEVLGEKTAWKRQR